MGRSLELLGEIGFGMALAAEIKLKYGVRCWAGEDGITTQDITVYPNIPTVIEGEGMYYKSHIGGLEFSDPPTEVSVLLKPGTIPPFSTLRFLPNSAELPVSANMLAALYEQHQHPLFLTSTKSRFAILGIEVSDWQKIPASTWRQIARGKEIFTPIKINNYAARPVIISSGMPLFRFVSPLLTPYLEGEELVQAYEDGLIEVEGTQGKTWEWVSTNKDDPQGLRMPKDIFGMRIKLKPGLRWIPPSNEPIRIENFLGSDYRSKIDALLEPVPDIDKPILCIAETYPLHLAASISGYISISARGCYGRQINSRYIDPLSNWGIRVEEILSPAMVRAEERYMEIYYLKSKV